mmetsp:Transcript_3107/g.4995  ORF Transcript_3107/g.4995 Transcript_3107/m.4995 type:complete len:160 (-) Transcript_3107:205-684(-)
MEGYHFLRASLHLTYTCITFKGTTQSQIHIQHAAYLRVSHLHTQIHTHTHTHTHTQTHAHTHTHDPVSCWNVRHDVFGGESWRKRITLESTLALMHCAHRFVSGRRRMFGAGAQLIGSGGALEHQDNQVFHPPRHGMEWWGGENGGKYKTQKKGWGLLD